MNLDDTIVAIATPPGRGGIGVIRLAGSRAREIALPMLRLKHELQPGRAILGEFIDRNGETAELRSAGQPGAAVPTSIDEQRIDEVVVAYFAKPHSYTTDDIVEISAHGSPVVLRHIVELCVAAGARLAEPGEFTMRAFLNGRMDLAQAEAVRDLIDSQTLYQAKIAAQQLEGALSRRLQPIKQKLVELIAVLEAGIDFAEDDVSVLPDSAILDRIDAIRQPLDLLAASFAYGKIVHQGFSLAIVGRPNVGKSSVFNRLVERERAIVTATPGTTRDLVSETVAIGGIPVQLVDTAGIRQALDEAESIGIRKSMEALADADLVLIVLDASQVAANGLTKEDQELLAQTRNRPAIVIENKCDLVRDQGDGQRHDQRLGQKEPSGPLNTSARMPTLRISALTGEGIADLRGEILRHIGGETGAQAEAGFLTNVRHQALVSDSLAALDAATTAVSAKVPHEMLLLDLYNALRPLDAITGATTNDD
ncbi:MAG: tRNA uridine-5-carboxymethylaminomethyl(34) synthesis GTPase MnmE, partial [Candidatus Sulfotelmatobacter sp.]